MCSKWLIIWTLVAAAGCQNCGATSAGSPSQRGIFSPSTDLVSDEDGDTETTACPVCGLEMKKLEAPFRFKYAGKTYYFFLKDHKDAFALDPSAYLPSSTDGPTIKNTPPQKK